MKLNHPQGQIYKLPSQSPCHYWGIADLLAWGDSSVGRVNTMNPGWSPESIKKKKKPDVLVHTANPNIEDL